MNSARNQTQRLIVIPQIIGEFYAIVTDHRRVPKPRSSNEALDVINQIVALPGITLLPQPVDFIALWTKLARRYPILGPKIYDLHLVAVMLAYNVGYIYTYNASDVQRYEEVRVVRPAMA